MDDAVPDLLTQHWRAQDRLAAAANGAGSRSRDRSLRRLTAQLRASRAAEEQVLYPELAARSTAAAGAAARGRRQHDELARLVAALRDAPARADRSELAGRLTGRLDEHRRETTQTLLPALAGLTAAEQRRLGRAFHRRYRQVLRGAAGPGGPPSALATLSVAALVLLRLFQRRRAGPGPAVAAPAAPRAGSAQPAPRVVPVPPAS